MVTDKNNSSTENVENKDQPVLDSAANEEDDLEAQMAANLATEGLTDSKEEDDLEAQMAAAMTDEMSEESEDDDLGKQMAEGDNGVVSESLLEKLSEEEETEESEVSVQSVQFQALRPSDEQGKKDNIDRLLDVSLSLSVELGRKQMQIKEILDLGPGKIIELDKLAGEPVDLLVNGRLLAKGEVVVVDENFGVRITDLISPKDRINSL